MPPGKAAADNVAAMNAHALELRGQAQLAQAQAVLERARELAEGHGDHGALTTTLSNLALVLEDQHRGYRAEILLERALRMRDLFDRRSKGGPHVVGIEGTLPGPGAGGRPGAGDEKLVPEAAVLMNNLAALLHARGELPAAERLYRKAHAVKVARLGADDGSTKLTKRNWDLLMQKRSRLQVGYAPHVLERGFDVRWMLESFWPALLTHHVFALEPYASDPSRISVHDVIHHVITPETAGSSSYYSSVDARRAVHGNL